MLSVTRSLPTDLIISAPSACHMTILLLYLQASKQGSGGLWPLHTPGLRLSLQAHANWLGSYMISRYRHLHGYVIHVQGTYADADSTATAFQAIAPVGVKHYQTYQLALSQVGQMENGQAEMEECKQPSCT